MLVICIDYKYFEGTFYQSVSELTLKVISNKLRMKKFTSPFCFSSKRHKKACMRKIILVRSDKVIRVLFVQKMNQSHNIATCLQETYPSLEMIYDETVVS